MALSKITYATKVALNPQPDIADENKVTDADMNEIKTIVNNAIDQVDTNTTNIGNITGLILWTNQSPTSSFAGQTINNLNLSNYDAYSIIYETSISGAVKKNTGIIKITDKAELPAIYYDAGIRLRYRQVTNITDSSITFGDGAGNGSTDNGVSVPLYIIVYKTNLFD